MVGEKNPKISIRLDEEAMRGLENIKKIIGTDSTTDATKYSFGMTDATLEVIGSGYNVPMFREILKYLPRIVDSKQKGNSIITVPKSYIETLREHGVLIIEEL